jgi:phosphopentomutase
VLGNEPASGTEIIQRLGEEHQRTGKWIVYTSADSVFQIAAHEETIPLEELYEACRTAREQLTGEHGVGRVIARPFEGSPGSYKRTSNRHDYSLHPARPNHLTRIREADFAVHAVGKIADIFAGCDIDTSMPTKSNLEGIATTAKLLREVESGLIFTNLVETDMLFGHRNDPAGFHRCLQEFDAHLPALRSLLRPDDLLVLTSDHGCDPTTESTDHSREHALLIAHAPSRTDARDRHDGWFSDVGATAAEWLCGRHDAAIPGEPIAL